MTLPRELVARCGANFPNRIAYYQGDFTRTWAEMHERSDRLAAGLQALGIGKGDAVGIIGYETFEIYEHFFACMKIGAIRVGINRRSSPLGLLHILRDSAIKVLFVQEHFLPLLMSIRDEVDALGIQLIGYGGNHGLSLDYERIQATGGTPDLPEIASDDALFYSYTSGTTGDPKGIILTHRSVVTAILQSMVSRAFAPDDIFYMPGQSSWMTVMMVMFGLVNGMSHVLPDGEFSVERFLVDIERLRVTVVSMVPTIMQRAVNLQRARNYDLASVRLISYGSAPAPIKLVREAYEVFGCDLLQAYGSTETGGWVTHLTPADHRRAISGEPELLTSAGQTGATYDLTIRDEDGNEVPPNVVGEIWVRGEAVMKGYLNMPELTAETFVGDWVRSNDIGRRDEQGYLYLSDRKKFMIITGAVNVFPAGVEAVLNRHPAIEETAVVGLPHPEWGEAVVAVIQTKAGVQHVAEHELLSLCQERLSKPECPKCFIFQPIPKTVNGKQDKNELKRLLHGQPELFSWKLAT